MRNKLKIISFVTSFLLFLMFFSFKFLFVSPRFYTPFWEGFYWIWFALVIDTCWVFSLKTQHLLYPSMVFLVLGAVLNVFGGFVAAEVVLRLWAVIFLVGITLLLIESCNSLPRIKNG